MPHPHGRDTRYENLHNVMTWFHRIFSFFPTVDMEMGTLDIAGAADSLTDIQTYLASFNKEIASPPALSDPTAAQPAAPFLPTSDLNSLFPGGTITVLQNQDGTTQLLLTSNVGESFPKVEPDGSKPVVADVTNVSLSTSDDLLPSTGVFPIIETKTETMVADQMNPQTPALTALDTQISMEQILSPVTPVTALATNSSGSQVIGQSAIFSVSNTTEVTQQPLLVTAPIQTSLQQPGVITVPAMPIQSNQLLINPTNPLQTMTLVPSEIQQDGEVKYVLVVSQQPDATQVVTEEQQSINLDMSIYDFKEDKSGQETKSAATPKKVIKVSPKKTPGGVQAQLMCNYCNYTSPKRYLLTRHMKTHSEERPHKCNICDRGFKTVASLQNHINTHTGIRPHRCKECASAFTTSGELVRHVRYKHTFEKPHKCSECDYSSVELSKLKRHMRSHTGERPFQCPQCTYASPDTYKLKRHLRIHTGEKPYICEICHSRFTQSNSLKSHKLIHTGNKPVFQCELCPTTCGRKTDLKIHVQKLHTSDKPLQCRKCGKSFPDRYTYKIHLKTHDGEKCYRCELCPYAALSQRHLQSHILTHTGEKPYACNECDQSFRQKQLLKRHKNLYHTPDYNPPAPREKVKLKQMFDRSIAHIFTTCYNEPELGWYWPDASSIGPMRTRFWHNAACVQRCDLGHRGSFLYPWISEKPSP